MIEREALVRVYSDALGVKGTKGRLVRVAPEGFYEITIESGGKNYTGLLPISSTVILSWEPVAEFSSLDVER
jgi:hypothetical protein